MIAWLKRWRPRHLLISWCAYWAATLLVLLWPVWQFAYHVQQSPDNHGTISAGFGDGGFTAKTTDVAGAVWTSSISLLPLTLLLAGPPLLLWVAWVVAVSRTNNAGSRAMRGTSSQQELTSGDKPRGIVDTSTSRRRAPEEA
jgi:hypothetical protein